MPFSHYSFVHALKTKQPEMKVHNLPTRKLLFLTIKASHNKHLGSFTSCKKYQKMLFNAYSIGIYTN